MGPLHRYLRLPRADRHLLIRAVFAVGAVRLGLMLVSFRTLRSLLAPLTRVRGTRAAVSRERVAWAVETASRCPPRTTCLVQALAAQLLLAREGCPSRLHFGVSRTLEGVFRAHAWLESDGRIVIGGPAFELQRYVRLLALDLGRS
jgi:transglutaminase superfamily protein